jgi:PAS domain S-box-containing protein
MSTPQQRQTWTAEEQAALLDLTHDAVFVRDAESGAITFWNQGAEDLYGWRWEEARGRRPHELLCTQFPVLLAEIEAAMVQRGRWDGELVHTTRDGRQVVVASRWALKRQDGRPEAFLEVNTDITAHKAAEEQVHALLAERERRVQEVAREHAIALHRNQELAAINDAVQSIAGSLNLAEVLQRIVDSARGLVGCRYAALGVADDQGHIRQFITSGITPEQRAAIGALPEGHGLLGLLIREARPLRIPNIGAHPQSQGFPPNHPPMKSLLGVPVLASGSPVGDLYLTDKIDADEFSENDEKLLILLAGHAAIAIQNARLYEQARAARDQLKRWNRDLEVTVAERTRQIEQNSKDLATHILHAQEEERKRIARELHDETGQSLSSILIHLDLLEPSVPAGNDVLREGITRLRTITERTWREIRALAHDLRPGILDDFGLVAALEQLAQEHTRKFDVPVAVKTDQTPHAGRLAPEVELALYRIAQEALNNAAKYAVARFIRIMLEVSHDQASLMVQDNGRGFDVERAAGPSRMGGLGLFGMRERAELLGGTLTIDAAPGDGTTIAVTVPLHATE